MSGMQRREEKSCHWTYMLGMISTILKLFRGVLFDGFVGSRNARRGDGYSGQLCRLCSSSSPGYFICPKVRSSIIEVHLYNLKTAPLSFT